MPDRSTDPLDYQAVPRPLAVMAKSFPDGFHIARHHHARAQLLWSVSGMLRVRTDAAAWIVPADRAVWLPAGVEHELDICGNVEMRTLYVAPLLSARPLVLEVSDLLRALILALVQEPVLYDESGRAGAIAGLILDEIGRARRLPLVLPMPRDPRLASVCAALLRDPASDLTLDGWAERAGASARTLARLFEREVGLSFAAWRQRVRFHNALEALGAGEPVGLVAARNGYRSASAFTEAFRRVMGVLPSELRPDPRRPGPLRPDPRRPESPATRDAASAAYPNG